MLTPKTSVVPPGGCHFVETLAEGREKRIEGNSFDDVARNLLLFRLTNGRAPGNPAGDVSNFICGQWPHFCNDSNPKTVTPTGSGGQNLATRVAAWMADLLREDNSTRIDDKEAQRRADICSTCRANVAFASGCGACMDNIDRLSFIFRAGRTLPQDPLLQACAATGQHNPSGVWANNLPRFSVEEAATMPSNCWRLQK